MEDNCRACGEKVYFIPGTEMDILTWYKYLNGEGEAGENPQTPGDQLLSHSILASDDAE